MRIPALEGIRAFAILLVVLLHFKIIYFGWMGVQIFFVLSGFLITRLLWAEKEQPFAACLKRFYWHRALRIFPAYFLCLLILSLACFFTGKPEAFIFDWPKLVTFTYNFSILARDFKSQFIYSHFWSLSVEMQFYLLAPWVIYFLDRVKLKLLIGALILIAPFVRLGLARWLQEDLYLSLHAGAAVNWFTFSQLDAFAFGAAIEIFELRKIRRPSLVLAGGAVLFLAAGILSYRAGIKPVADVGFLASLGYPYYFLKGYQPAWTYTLVNLLGMLLVLTALEPNQNLIQKILGSRFMTGIGKVSYGMYLYNFALLQLWVTLFGVKLRYGLFQPLFVPYAIALFCLSWVSYQFFESKFLALKKMK